LEILDPVILRLLGNVEGKRLLDAGCGEGRLARLLAERGAQVSGIDIVPGLVELARSVDSAKHGRAAGERLEELKDLRRCRGALSYYVADVTRLPRRFAGFFDSVVACCTLNCVADLSSAARGLSLSLRERGECVVAIPHPEVIRPRLKKHKVKSPFGSRCVIPYTEYIAPGLEVVNYYRPLSAFVSVFGANGLLLDRLEEPLLSMTAIRRNSRHVARIRKVRCFPAPSVFPWFLIARFVRVAANGRDLT
jgi:SAM-dependent methyltransferase